jgi:hypothetical protein
MKMNKSSTLVLGFCLVGLIAQNAAAENFDNNIDKILFTDSSAVLKADAASGGPAVVASGAKLVQTFGICMGKGEYFVTDTSWMGILGIDANGNQRVVPTGAGLGVPYGIAADSGGSLLVANGEAVLRVDPKSGAHTKVASGVFLNAPIALDVAANGSIFVVDALGTVVEVDPRNGGQKLIATGGYLQRPQGIAVYGKNVYVTDVATGDSNFGIGRVIQINAQTGEQKVLAEGQNLVGPVGIAADQNGNLIVADPYTINEESADLFDGGIIKIDAATGAQTLIARGKEGFVNPRGVAIAKH